MNSLLGMAHFQGRLLLVLGRVNIGFLTWGNTLAKYGTIKINVWNGNHRFENTACLFGLFVSFFLWSLRNYCDPDHPWVFLQHTRSDAGGEWQKCQRQAHRQWSSTRRGTCGWTESGKLMFFFIERWFLGGGNSNIFYFQPYVGKMSNLNNIFFRWVETTNWFCLKCFVKKGREDPKWLVYYLDPHNICVHIYMYVILCTWMKSPIYVYGAEIIRFWIGFESWVRL